MARVGRAQTGQMSRRTKRAGVKTQEVEIQADASFVKHVCAKLLDVVYEATILRMGLLSRNSFRERFGTYREDLFSATPGHAPKGWPKTGAQFLQE